MKGAGVLNTCLVIDIGVGVREWMGRTGSIMGGGGGAGGYTLFEPTAKLPPRLSGTDRPLYFIGVDHRPLKSAFSNIFQE